jgi:hypothetical protein
MDAEAADPGAQTDASGGSDAITYADVVEIMHDISQFIDAVKEVLIPQTPAAPKATLFSDAPCGYPASLTFDDAQQSFFASCGGAPSTLYRFTPAAYGGDSSWGIVGTVIGYPSNHITLPDGFHVVAHSGPDGFTIIDGVTGETTDSVDLATETIGTPGGGTLTFKPNNPSGIVLAGGMLCVATSNLDHIDSDPAKTTYFPGTIICSTYAGDGTVAHDSVAYFTSGVNPTGVVLIDATAAPDGIQHFAVLSSNSYADTAEGDATLDIFDAPVMNKDGITIKMDDGAKVQGQISPVLTMTDGSMILIGTQRPYPAVIGIDAGTGAKVFERKVPGVQNFISGVSAFHDIAAVSDFGQFGSDGGVFFIDTRAGGWSGIPATSVPGNLGPAVVNGNTLYQATTGADMTSSIYSLDLTGLGN